MMTEPELVARWTTTGQGGRPDGFAPVDAPRSLHYTWRGEEDSDDVTDVTYLLEETPEGTRFTWRHTGFTGLGGFAMAALLGRVRRRMLTEGVPPVLEAYRRSRP